MIGEYGTFAKGDVVDFFTKGEVVDVAGLEVDREEFESLIKGGAIEVVEESSLDD